MAELWERQEGEGIKPFSYFCVYRDLGYTRTFDKAIEEIYNQTGKKVKYKYIASLSSTYKWAERARAYDEYLECRKREEYEEEIMEAVRRQVTISRSLQQKAGERLREIDVSDMKYSELTRMFDIGARNEREAYLMPVNAGAMQIDRNINVNIKAGGDLFDAINKYKAIIEQIITEEDGGQTGNIDGNDTAK